MVSSAEVARALAQLVERSRTSGRPGSDDDLGDVLGTALDRYELARLYLVATARLGCSPIPERPWEYVRTLPERWTPDPDLILAANRRAAASRAFERAERLDRI